MALYHKNQQTMLIFLTILLFGGLSDACDGTLDYYNECIPDDDTDSESDSSAVTEDYNYDDFGSNQPDILVATSPKIDCTGSLQLWTPREIQRYILESA